jgi:hypothetical protein
MKKWNLRKLVVSSIIFLFTVMAGSPIVGQATPTSNPETIPNIVVQAAVKAPYVQMHAPKIAKLDNMGDQQVRGSRVFVRQIVDSSIVATALMHMYVSAKTHIATNESPYGSGGAAYVNLSGSNLANGFLKIDGIDNSIASRIEAVMQTPEKYGLDSSTFNVEQNPRLIEVATVDIHNNMIKSQVLAMDISSVHLDKDSLKNMLNKVYSTFKGYVDVMAHRLPGQSTQIHTGFIPGTDAKVMTILQMIAADLSGVDQLTFHNVGTNPGVVQDAQNFLQARQGQDVNTILDALSQ